MRFNVTCAACGHREDLASLDLEVSLQDPPSPADVLEILEGQLRSGNCRVCGHDKTTVTVAV